MLQSSAGTLGDFVLTSRVSGPGGTLGILGDTVSVTDGQGTRVLEPPADLVNPAPNPPDGELLVTAYDKLHALGIDLAPYTKLFLEMRDAIGGKPAPTDPAPGTFEDGVALQRILDAIRRSDAEQTWERLA